MDKVKERFKDISECGALIKKAQSLATGDFAKKFIEQLAENFAKYKGETNLSDKQFRVLKGMAEGRTAPRKGAAVHRERFAGLAMQALITKNGATAGEKPLTAAEIATKSWQMADIMVKAGFNPEGKQEGAQT